MRTAVSTSYFTRNQPSESQQHIVARGRALPADVLPPLVLQQVIRASADLMQSKDDDRAADLAAQIASVTLQRGKAIRQTWWR